MELQKTYYKSRQQQTTEMSNGVAKTESGFKQNMFVNMVCALAVILVVLALYMLNAETNATPKVVIQNCTDAGQVNSDKDKNITDDSFSSRLMPLRLIQFLQ